MTLRGRATSYRMKNFEDVVIFSIDVERCPKSLEFQARQLVVKIAIQEYMFLEAAERMGLDAKTVARRYGDALDELTAEFIKKKLLTEDEEKRCQEG